MFRLRHSLLALDPGSITERLESVKKQLEQARLDHAHVQSELQNIIAPLNNVLMTTGLCSASLLGLVANAQVGVLYDSKEPCACFDLTTYSYSSDNLTTTMPSAEKDVHRVRLYGMKNVQFVERYLLGSKDALPRVGLVWVRGVYGRHEATKPGNSKKVDSPTLHVLPPMGIFRFLKFL